MFTIDPNITAVPLKEKKLFKVLFSMNTHQVATPEMGLAEARSYVFFFHEGNKRLSAYIGIYLFLADRRFFYPYSGNPFLENEMGTVEEEARSFVDDLGAMLDELDCAHMSDLEMDSWIETQDLFSRTPAPEAKPEAQPVAALQPETLQAAPKQQPPQMPPVPQMTLETQAAPVSTPPVSSEPQRVQPSAAAPSQAPAMQPVAEPQPAQTGKASTDPLAAAATTGQDIIQKTVKAEITKAPKQLPKQGPASPTGVVSRNREALARLLTSF